MIDLPALRLRTALTTSVILATACTPSTDARVDASVRVDTVDAVAVHTSSGEPPQWQIDSLFAVGGEGGNGALSFGDVGAIAVDHDGNVYVADGMDLDISVFSAAGTHLRTIARKGEGPGEIGGAGPIALLGDTLMVFDAGNLRLGLFSTNGEWIGQWPLRPANGLLISTGPREVWARTVRWRGSRYDHVYVRHDQSGAVDTVPYRLAQPPGAGPSNSVDCEMGDGSIALYSASPRYRAFSVIRPTASRMFAESAPAGYMITLTTANGDTVRVLRHETADTAVSDAEWAAEESAWSEFRRAHEGGCCTEGISRPSRKRLIADLATDDSANIWVTRVRAANDTVDRIDVLTQTGEMIGSLTVPSHSLSAARAGRLVLVTADSLGVETVRAYAISRSRR